jgi:hypothetical protein
MCWRKRYHYSARLVLHAVIAAGSRWWVAAQVSKNAVVARLDRAIQ